MGFKRRSHLSTFVALIILCWSSQTFAANPFAGKKQKSILSITAFSNSYTDIRSASTPADDGISASYDIELAVRIHSLFNVAALYGKFTEDERSNYGAGFRIDTPGFFWIGARSGDFRQAKRKYPVNTSLFAFLIQHEEKDETTRITTRSVGSSLGLSIDFFLFNPHSYLATQASIYNIQGNAFASYGVGLGVQF